MTDEKDSDPAKSESFRRKLRDGTWIEGETTGSPEHLHYKNIEGTDRIVSATGQDGAKLGTFDKPLQEHSLKEISAWDSAHNTLDDPMRSNPSALVDHGKYHYLSREHQGHRDLFTTDEPATLERDTSREYGLPMAKDVGEKQHLYSGQDHAPDFRTPPDSPPPVDSPPKSEKKESKYGDG